MDLLGPVGYWKEQSHEKWAHFTHPPKIHGRKTTGGGTLCPPPCGIGLSILGQKYEKIRILHELRWETARKKFVKLQGSMEKTFKMCH